MVTWKYVIVPAAGATAEMVTAGGVSSLGSARHSLDGALVVFRYAGAQPAVFAAFTEYSHAEILVETMGAAWENAE